jgi:hypothetical protein
VYGARWVAHDLAFALGALPGAKGFEQRPHDRDIGDARHAVQRDGRLREQGGGHDRKGCIFRAVGLDRAGKAVAAAHAQRCLEPIEDVHSRQGFAPPAGDSAPARAFIER